MSKEVFVFGSNEAGIHGAGAAVTALKHHNAQYGKGYGHYGDSFAIPTKNSDLVTLRPNIIGMYVTGFLAYASGHKKLSFKVTRIGCGLAGLSDEVVANLFLQGSGLSNLHFDDAWQPWLGEECSYWGSFP